MKAQASLITNNECKSLGRFHVKWSNCLPRVLKVMGLFHGCIFQLTSTTYMDSPENITGAMKFVLYVMLLADS